MNQNRKFIFGASIIGVSFFSLTLGLAQDASQTKWTVIGDSKSSTISSVSAAAVVPLSESTIVQDGEWTVVDAKKMAIDKAIKGIRSPDLFKSPEITQESIELMFAPYRTQDKAEFFRSQVMICQTLLSVPKVSTHRLRLPKREFH